MSQVQNIIKRARAYVALQGNSKAALSREAGLHANTLRNLDKPDFNCDAITLEKLEKYLSKHA